jgi:hypothetical protein
MISMCSDIKGDYSHWTDLAIRSSRIKTVFETLIHIASRIEVLHNIMLCWCELIIDILLT